MDIWSLAGPLDGVSGETLSEVMAAGAGLWKRPAASLLNYSEVENIKKEKGDYRGSGGLKAGSDHRGPPV